MNDKEFGKKWVKGLLISIFCLSLLNILNYYLNVESLVELQFTISGVFLIASGGILIGAYLINKDKKKDRNRKRFSKGKQGVPE